MRGAETDLAWFRPNGDEMHEDDWGDDQPQVLAVFLGGDAIETGARGELVTDDDFLWLINAHDQPVRFTVPPRLRDQCWHVVVDTADGEITLEVGAEVSALESGEIEVGARAQIVLRALCVDGP